MNREKIIRAVGNAFVDTLENAPIRTLDALDARPEADHFLTALEAAGYVVESADTIARLEGEKAEALEALKPFICGCFDGECGELVQDDPNNCPHRAATVILAEAEKEVKK